MNDDSLMDKCFSLERKLEEKNEIIADLRANIYNLQTDNLDLNSKIQLLEQQIISQNLKIESLNSNLYKLRRDIRDWEDKYYNDNI